MLGDVGNMWDTWDCTYAVAVRYGFRGAVEKHWFLESSEEVTYLPKPLNG